MNRPQIPTAPSDYLRCLTAGHLDAVDDIETYRRAVRGGPDWSRCPRCGLSQPPATDATVDTGQAWLGWSP